MRKFAHKITANKRNELPHILIFVDTETYPEPYVDNLTLHKLKLGVACYVERREKRNKNTESWITFRKQKEFWDWIEKKIRPHKTAYVFAHNMHFDFFVLGGFVFLPQKHWEVQKVIIDSNRFIVTFKKDTRKLIFLDSGNIIKVPLALIGKSVGLEKLHVDFDTVSDKELEIYCKRDVEILKEFILRYLDFIKREDLGNFGYTISKQSFNAFRHRFMKHDIYVHANPKVIELERKSYRGGRCEAFYIGSLRQHFYELDINSMYPYVMHKYQYPVKLVNYICKANKRLLKKLLQIGYGVISHVKIKTNEPAFAVKKERLIFPIGTFHAYLCTPELEYALANANIVDVYELAYYEMKPIFREFVEYFYAKRQIAKKTGDKLNNLFFKLILNSLYGKFGQKNEVWKHVKNLPLPITSYEEVVDAKTLEKKKYYSIAGKVFEKVAEEEAFDSFVAIASHVTAYARMYLWQLIKQAGLENVYYVDTDSLVVNDAGFNRLGSVLHQNKLGKLKVEFEFNNLEIRGPKDYSFDDVTKMKGIKKNAKKISNSEYEQEQFLKSRSLIRKNIIFASATRLQRKKLKREYKKGIVCHDGRVKPYFIEDI